MKIALKQAFVVGSLASPDMVYLSGAVKMVRRESSKTIIPRLKNANLFVIFCKCRIFSDSIELIR